MNALRNIFILLAVGALLVVVGCTLLPSTLHALNPNVTYRIPNVGKTLYITLDDSHSSTTSLILEVLHKHGVQATFFVITDHIHSESLSRILAEGHQLGHHMKSAAKIKKMEREQFEREFLEADKVLSAYPRIKLFRPPDGSITNEQAEFVKSRGYSIIVGTIFPLDHWLESEFKIAMLAKALVVDGGVIIMHDTDSRGRRTAAVLDTLIPYFRSKGYQFGQLQKPIPN